MNQNLSLGGHSPVEIVMRERERERKREKRKLTSLGVRWA